MTPPPPYTSIRTPADLLAAWEGLMGPWGFGTSSIWVLFLDADDRLLPTMQAIDDRPAEPEDDVVRNLVHVLADVLDSGAATSVALLLSRPGMPGMTEADRRWARALHRMLDGPLGRWPLHLATRNRVQVFAPDDLIAA
jgi:hypothetical protein